MSVQWRDDVAFRSGAVDRRSLTCKGAVLAALAALTAAAQGPGNGVLRGVVYDPADTGLPGATITAVGPVEKSVAADESGGYELSDLPAGSYEVRAGLQGFCTETRRNVRITEGTPARADFRMNLLTVGWGEFAQPHNLRQAYRQADVVAHLRIDRSLGAGIWDVKGGDTVGLAYAATIVSTAKPDAERPTNTGRLEFIQYPAGTWNDDETTRCGDEPPYAPGDEYVAFLAWSAGDAKYRFLRPEYMIPVHDGRLVDAQWESYDTPGLADGITVASFFDVLRTIPVTPQPIDDPEAYAVYASLLPASWPEKVGRATRLVFTEEAITDFRCLPHGGVFETEWSRAFAGFKRATESPRTLLPGFDLRIPYIVVPRAEIQAIKASETDPMMFGWANFYRRFPDSGGNMYFSPVGFDATKRHAIVFMGHTCGGLCGSEGFYFLQKTDGRWQRVRPYGVQACGVSF
jgi:hypothetical protein